MANMSSTSPDPRIGNGIPMPWFNNDYKVWWKTSDSAVTQTLASQITSIKFNYVKSELVLTIEQPRIGGALHEFLMGAIKRENPPVEKRVTLTVCAVDNPPFSLKYEVEPIDHIYELKYQPKTEVSVHVITFKIINMSIE